MQVTATALDALRTGFDASFRKGQASVTATYTQVATVVNSTTRSNTYSWLGKMKRLREWIGDRVVEKLSKHGYSIENKTFEATVGVSRDDIEDDNIGIYGPMLEDLGQAAELHPDETVYTLLKNGFTTPCFDGQNFFDDEHPVKPANGAIPAVTASNMQPGAKPLWVIMQTNRPLKPLIWQWRRKPKLTAMDQDKDGNTFTKNEYHYGTDLRGEAGFGFWQMAFGSKADLTAANFEANKTKMRNFKDENDRPLGIRPNLIVVGPSNRAAADRLFTRKTVDGSDNEYYGAVEILEVDWLE